MPVINRTCEISGSVWGIRASVNAAAAQNGKFPKFCEGWWMLTRVSCCIQRDTRHESRRSRCCLNTSQSWFLTEREREQRVGRLCGGAEQELKKWKDTERHNEMCNIKEWRYQDNILYCFIIQIINQRMEKARINPNKQSDFYIPHHDLLLQAPPPCSHHQFCIVHLAPWNSVRGTINKINIYI